MNRFVRCFLLTLALAVSPPLLLQAREPTQATLNLKDVDIGVLIQAVSEMTGRGFIVDPKVQGKVSKQPPGHAQSHRELNELTEAGKYRIEPKHARREANRRTER